MPTLRFEGTTLEQTMRTAAESSGPGARVLDAVYVRRRGLGGFFADEHIEVDVEVPGQAAVTAKTPCGTAVAEHEGPIAESTWTKKGSLVGWEPGPDKDLSTGVGQPVAHASKNLDQTRTNNAVAFAAATLRSLSEPVPLRQMAPSPPVSHLAVDDMLERIARKAGLVGPAGPSGWLDRTEVALETETSPVVLARSPVVANERERHFATPTGIAPPRHLTSHAQALAALGLPADLCKTIARVTDVPSLEAELTRALSEALPTLPALPRLGTSVLAVVGAPNRAMARALELASEMGAPSDDVALATRRKVWRARACVIASPAEVREARQKWRWRCQPTVVAVEHPVRPTGNDWARSILETLEPALCYGVADAFHKIEDLAAWSDGLGGLDVVDLVDLDGTTTPAAALGCGVPVGRLDGEPATSQAWARLLCHLLGK
ncbi:MAG TPA: hypothetical protein VEJ84_11455 [Acidimicrobiales bacterium]|nr:hypothetical protein [Acidimicrobiales bacterium]